MNDYLTLALIVALILGIACILIKLADIYVSDMMRLRGMSDNQLLASIQWEKAEGRSAKKLEAEYARRHGSVPC